MNPSESPLIGAVAIQERVKSLAELIRDHYRDQPLSIIGLLNGSLFFLVDLIRLLPLETQVECWRVHSYQGTASTGEIKGLESCFGDLSGRSVLIVDDILETGRTLHAVSQRARELGAKEIEICVLLRKNVPRKVEVDVKWVGFELEHEFVIGYGLDFDGKYRGLPAIHILE